MELATLSNLCIQKKIKKKFNDPLSLYPVKYSPAYKYKKINSKLKSLQ